MEPRILGTPAKWSDRAAEGLFRALTPGLSRIGDRSTLGEADRVGFLAAQRLACGGAVEVASILLVILLSGCGDSPNCDIAPRACNEDTDCVLVADDPAGCGCEAGGSTRAVNAECADLFPDQGVCQQIYSCRHDVPVALCRLGRCDMAEGSVDPAR